MERRTIDLVTTWIRRLALPMILVAWLTGGGDAAIGALGGAVLALANWTVIRRIALEVVTASDAARARMAFLLVVKTGVIGALVMLFARVFDATGLLLGVSAMVVGVLAGAMHAHVRWHRASEAPACAAAARGGE
jgi:hypothetical protein